MTTLSFSSLFALSLILGGNLAMLPTPATAQENATFAFGLNQAKNLARQAAEEANGGIGKYRAEGSMHGPAEASPHTMNEGGGYTFIFSGRSPESLDFTYESEVTVSPSGQIEVLYNGAIREDADITDVEEVSIDLNQAKNLARQTAEEANGGLGNYRAEDSMHNNPNESPFVENTDGSYTFTFKGRRPESLNFTYESQIKVSRDGQAKIIYNRSVESASELPSDAIEPAAVEPAVIEPATVIEEMEPIAPMDSTELDQPFDEFAPQSP
ncbi:MAG: hypothetical protein WBB82_08625 [Limnothrix sp.]